MSDKDTTAKKSDDTAETESTASKQQKIQVVDVSHPGKSAPSATSRPVIVGSGSYMKDPMVSQPSAKEDTDDAPSSDKSAVGGGKVIQPLGGTVDAKSSEEDTEGPEQPNNDTNKQADEATADDSTESSAEANNQAGSDAQSSAGSSESAVVHAVLGQVDEKGNAVDDPDQADDQIKQLIQEKKYFVSVSKPKQSYGSLIVTIVSIIVIIATIVVVAAAYDIISLL